MTADEVLRYDELCRVLDGRAVHGDGEVGARRPVVVEHSHHLAVGCEHTLEGVARIDPERLDGVRIDRGGWRRRRHPFFVAFAPAEHLSRAGRGCEG
jgi:hypothetical protein